jgi:hypothetical protein
MTSIKAAADLLIWIASTPPLLPKPGVKRPRDVVPVGDALGLLRAGALVAEGGGFGAPAEGDLDALPHLELGLPAVPSSAATPTPAATATAPDSAGGTGRWYHVCMLPVTCWVLSCTGAPSTCVDHAVPCTTWRMIFGAVCGGGFPLQQTWGRGMLPEIQGYGQAPLGGKAPLCPPTPLIPTA